MRVSLLAMLIAASCALSAGPALAQTQAYRTNQDMDMRPGTQTMQQIGGPTTAKGVIVQGPVTRQKPKRKALRAKPQAGRRS
jgi:hypothetical protein